MLDAFTIQRALKARGFDLGKSGPNRDGVDGWIGTKTKQAVVAFQRAKGMRATGVVDYLTGVALMAPVDADKPSPAAPAPAKPSFYGVLDADWMPQVPMRGIVVHWTGGTHTASANDRSHYHVLIEGDGEVVRGKPSIALNASTGLGKGYAAHTRGLNTGWIGVSLCCMGGNDVRESPFNAGKWPMTRAQWDKLPLVLAALCHRYKIAVTPQTVLSHAEVQGTLGRPQLGKWDITRLAFDPSVQGAKACGDLFRRNTLALMF